MPTAPPAIAPCSTYFERADELKGVQPFVAHHLRLFGVEMAMKMAGHGQADAGRFLIAQMDVLEGEKKDGKFKTPPTTRKAFKVAPTRAPPAPAAAAAAVDVSDSAKDGEKDEKEKPTEADAKKEADGKKEDGAKKDQAPAKKDDKKEGDAADAVSEDLKKLSTWGDEVSTTKTPGEPKPKVEYRTVQQTPTEAFKSFALDLYERARAADDPKAYPSASTSWGVVEAPKIARGLHASAVILDGLKQFGALPADLEPFQKAAYRRSLQLGQQIQNSFKTPSPVPLEWAPVDTNAPFASYKPPAPAPPPPMFPSAGSGPVRR